MLPPFLDSALGAGAGSRSAGSASVSRATPAQRTIVEPVHLWKANTPDWRWVPGAAPQLPEPFTIDVLPLMDEAGVDRVVSYRRRRATATTTRWRLPSAIPTASLSWAASRSRIRYRPRCYRSGRSSRACSASLDVQPPRRPPGSRMVPPTGSGRRRRRLAFAHVPATGAAAVRPIAERHPQLTLIIDHMG